MLAVVIPIDFVCPHSLVAEMKSLPDRCRKILLSPLSQSEIGALAQGIVEIVISIGELQGLKPSFFGFI
jgi:hypothetical protein